MTTYTTTSQLADEPQSTKRFGVVGGLATLLHVLSLILAVVLTSILALVLVSVLTGVLALILSGVLAIVLGEALYL